MEAYYESSILIFMNNVVSLAIEQCLLSGAAKILSSATVRNMEDDELQAIAAESDETVQERAKLSDRVKTLKKGLSILKFHPASRMQRAKPNPATPEGKSPLPADARAAHNLSATAKARPVESVLNTSSTDMTNMKPFFAFSNPITFPSEEAKTVAPSRPFPQSSTSATKSTAPAPNLFGRRSLKGSNIFNAGGSRTGGLFGQPILAKPAGSTHSSNCPSVFTSTSPFSSPAGTSNSSGNSATKHPTSELSGSPLANNTDSTSSTQPSGLFNSNRTISTLFPGNAPQGTPSPSTPFIEEIRFGQDIFKTITAHPAYQKMSLEVGLLRHAQETTNAKYLQELRLEDYALGRK